MKKENKAIVIGILGGVLFILFLLGLTWHVNPPLPYINLDEYEQRVKMVWRSFPFKQTRYIAHFSVKDGERVVKQEYLWKGSILGSGIYIANSICSPHNSNKPLCVIRTKGCILVGDNVGFFFQNDYEIFFEKAESFRLGTIDRAWHALSKRRSLAKERFNLYHHQQLF